MKKFIVAVMMCFAVATAAKAQDTKYAVGLRFGGSAELLFDYNLSSENFLQFTVAFPNYDGVALTGIYNWRCCEWNWTPRTCTWNLNAGVGAALGMYNVYNDGFLIGVAGSCAFDLLSVPLQAVATRASSLPASGTSALPLLTISKIAYTIGDFHPSRYDIAPAEILRQGRLRMMRFRTGLGACPNKGRYRVLVATQSQNAYSMPSESDTGLRCRCAV